VKENVKLSMAWPMYQRRRNGEAWPWRSGWKRRRRNVINGVAAIVEMKMKWQRRKLSQLLA
jgi:hypothetical protein